MKAPHAGGMGEQGHDESVSDASQAVHTAPKESDILEDIGGSPLDLMRHLHRGRKGFLYGAVIHDHRQVDKPYWRFYSSDMDGYADSLFNFPEGKNCYFGPALRSEKGQITSYMHTDLIWFDCDMKDLAEDRKAEGVRLRQLPPDELEAHVAAAYAQLMDKYRAMGMEPIYTLYSGHGFQGAFRAPRLLAREETEAANRALASRFAEFGADKAVTNLGTLLRAPGTNNVKNPERPIRTKIWHLSEAVLSEEVLVELIAEGTTEAPPTVPGEAKQTPQPSQRDGGGLIDWYNDRTLLGPYLLGQGYERVDDGRLKSPYSETGRDVTLLLNKKGVQCAYLHSSSHPMSQWLGLDGEALSKHRIDPFEFFVYYEHSNVGKVPYDEARKVALRSVAAEREAELITQTLEEQSEQVVLPDANAIPAPMQQNKDKLDYSDAQAVRLLGLPEPLSVPDDDLAFAARLMAQTSAPDTLGN